MFNLVHSKILKSLFSYISALITSQILMAIYTLGIIWWLSSEEYGVLAANYATVTMLSFIITLGLHEWLIRTIPKSTKSNPITGAILRYKLSIGFVWGAGIWLIMTALQPHIYQKDILAIIIIDVWLDSALNLLLADLLGNQKTKLTSILLISSRLLRVISLGIIILLNSTSILMISLLRLTSTLIVFSIALNKTKPILFKKPEVSTDIKSVIKSSKVFTASELFNLVFLQLDLNLFAWVSGDLGIIGSYAITMSLINMIITLPLALVSLLLPSTIKIYQLSREKFQKRIKQLLAGFFSLGLLFFVGARLLNLVWIQELITNNYKTALYLFLLASPILLLRTLNQFNRVYLLTVGLEQKQLIPQAISILLKVIIGIFVIGKWDIVGFIWLSIMIDFLMLISYSTYVFKHSKDIRIGLIH